MCCALFHEWQLATPATPQGEGGFHPLYYPKINTRYLLKDRKLPTSPGGGLPTHHVIGRVLSLVENLCLKVCPGIPHLFYGRYPIGSCEARAAISLLVLKVGLEPTAKWFLRPPPMPIRVLEHNSRIAALGSG